MKHSGTQRLETERLVLRRFVNEDAEAMYKNWAADEEVTKYLTWPPHSNQEVSQRVIEEWVKAYQIENELSKEQILELFNSIKFSFNENQLLEDILINIKAASSKREAREFIKNGAITINNQKMIDPNKTFNKDELIANSFLIIRRGKKNFYLVELN